MKKKTALLPQDERKRRKREGIVIILAIIFTFMLTSLLVYLIGNQGGTQFFPQNSLVLVLVNINAILLLLLVFLVVRNIVKLFFERRRGVLGSKLRTKLVVAFVGLSLVPTLLLFWVSIGFITNTIENWFSFKVESSLEEALKVSRVYYKNSESNALHYARQISNKITDNKLLNEENLVKLREFVNEKQVEYNLGVVEVFSSQREELLKVMNPMIPDKSFISPDSHIVQLAFDGKENTYVHSFGKSDIIRGVVPVLSTWNKKDVVGVVVVNYYVKQSLVSKMDTIKRAFMEYKDLKLSKFDIKFMYVILLSVVTLLIIFSATWFGFHLSKVISVPISSLANATQQVAQGNLDFKIDPASDDEIGSLIDSFNKMTSDLRVSQDKVESTTNDLKDTITELDHRRLNMEILLDNVAAVVVSVDNEGLITTFNKYAEKMFKISMDDVLLHHYKDVFAIEPLNILSDHIDEINKFSFTAMEKQLTLSFQHKTIFLFTRSRMLFDRDENYMGLVIVAEDLTQIQQVQRAYAWKEVARRVAHEVKNPLTPIKLSAQRLRKKFGGQIVEDQKIFDECTKTIITQVDELKILINEFSTFARLPATNLVLNDLNLILTETLSFYREAHKNINIELVPERENIRFNFDRDQIKRVIINLLDNSVSSMENDGRITVRTKYDKSLEIVIIEVSDTGQGIAKDIRQKIFEPYFSTKKFGTGLGLAIVNNIIADHNGYIRVRDNDGKGTCFVIELPVGDLSSIKEGTIT